MCGGNYTTQESIENFYEHKQTTKVFNTEGQHVTLVRDDSDQSVGIISPTAHIEWVYDVEDDQEANERVYDTEEQELDAVYAYALRKVAKDGYTATSANNIGDFTTPTQQRQLAVIDVENQTVDGFTADQWERISVINNSYMYPHVHPNFTEEFLATLDGDQKTLLQAAVVMSSTVSEMASMLGMPQGLIESLSGLGGASQIADLFGPSSLGSLLP